MFTSHPGKWDYTQVSHGVGGIIPTKNLSQFYHGLLKQWWNHYDTGGKKLFTCENINVKKMFQQMYPEDTIHILDYYLELQNSDPKDIDIIGNLCEVGTIPENSYSCIVSQACLEHVEDPFGAMKNMIGGLRPGGCLVVHTVTAGGKFPYHAVPRDYFRFYADWWVDLPKFIDGIKLVELYESPVHVFACYVKLSE